MRSSTACIRELKQNVNAFGANSSGRGTVAATRAAPPSSGAESGEMSGQPSQGNQVINPVGVGGVSGGATKELIDR